VVFPTYCGRRSRALGARPSCKRYHFVGACTDNNPGQDNLDVVDADPVQFGTAINTHTRGASSVASDAVTVTDWQPTAAGTGGNAGDLCGANACVLIYKSIGGDDQSVVAQEEAEDRPVIPFSYCFTMLRWASHGAHRFLF
jgi:hypothetical protein